MQVQDDAEGLGCTTSSRSLYGACRMGGDFTARRLLTILILLEGQYLKNPDRLSILPLRLHIEGILDKHDLIKPCP